MPALLVFWFVGCWAVVALGLDVGACAVALTSAYVPPDASSDDASTAPTTNMGPTVRFGFADGVDAGGGAAKGLDVAADGWLAAAVVQLGASGGRWTPGVDWDGNGSFIGSSRPRRTFVCVHRSGAQESIVGRVSESRLTGCRGLRFLIQSDTFGLNLVGGPVATECSPSRASRTYSPCVTYWTSCLCR